MNNRWILLPALCGLLLAPRGAADAAIIRLVDDDGVVIYTDNPWQFEVYRRQLDQDGGGDPDSSTRDAASESGASGSGDGAARARKAESTAEEVMRLAGLDAQIEILSAMAQDDFERLLSRFWRTEAVRDSVARTFNPDQLRQDVSRGLARRLDSDRSRALLVWLRSPLSRRIVALESAPPSPDRAAAEAAFINQLPAAPPAAARLVLIHRIDRAEEATETTAVIMAATTAALRRALAPFARGFVRGATSDQEETNPAALDEALRFRTVTSLLFAYRDLDDRDLGRYATFLESPTGRWFIRISRAAILDALRPPEKPPAAPATTARK